MKTASLIYFYMGDSYLTTLAQETVPLHEAMDGYDRSVLLKHNIDAGPFKISAPAEREAAVVMAPTKENLVEQLRALHKAGYVIDLFIFAHGFRNGFVCSKGTHGDTGRIRGAWIEDQFKGETLRLRIVYSIACWGESLNDTWAKLGAKASLGTKSVNFYPTRFRRFIRLWNKGNTLAGSAQKSDSVMVHVPVQVYIQADSVLTTTEWRTSLRQGLSVLRKSNAAEAYFRKMWIGDDWVEGKSGRQNMNLSSKQVIAGNRRIKKTTSPRW